MYDENAMGKTSSSMANQSRRWAARCLAVYWIVLLAAMHFPRPVPRMFPSTGSDKVAHFFAYSALTVLLGWWMFAGQSDRAALDARRIYLRGMLVVALVVAYGLIDEWTQPLTNRDFDWWDWAADATAAVLTGGVVTLLVLRRKRRMAGEGVSPAD